MRPPRGAVYAGALCSIRLLSSICSHDLCSHEYRQDKGFLMLVLAETALNLALAWVFWLMATFQ